jgi:hypothetical protein
MANPRMKRRKRGQSGQRTVTFAEGVPKVKTQQREDDLPLRATDTPGKSHSTGRWVAPRARVGDEPSIDVTLSPHQAPKNNDPETRALLQQSMRDMSLENPIPESALNMSLRPADVVQIRNQMVYWWSTPGIWQQRYALQGRRPIEGFDHGPLEAESARTWMEIGFKDADLFYVSPEMSNLVSTMAPTIPDCVPQPPVKRGFVVFARSIAGTDAESGSIIYTTAYLWQPVQTVLGPCIGIESYSWRDLIHTYRMMSDEAKDQFRQAMPMRLHPTGGQEWPEKSETTDFSMIPASNQKMETSMLEDRRVLSTFWALCSQRIAVEEPFIPDRAMRRQAERERWPHIPKVRIIRLREATRPKKDGPPSEIEWSHRWLVGAHWRNQWYASTQEHRPKLIEAYVKGPDDKPLVVRETVRALVR